MSSSLRSVLFRDFNVRRLWSAWRNGYIISSVVRRCGRERGIREVLHRFKYAFFRPHRTLLMAVTAACNSRSDDSNCNIGITDDELEALLTEVEVVKELVKCTLCCNSCGKRLAIQKKQLGMQYCECKDAQPAEESVDGWVPFMEAEDVIIWRKEYKPGQGLYAYKVYGRYPEVCARDFAAVQLDGAYRRAWDAAVAALAVVQRRAQGVHGQAVLHWEVLWPRLFANRDYVYIRRHKEFNVINERPTVKDVTKAEDRTPTQPERENVHSNAKRKSLENYAREREGRGKLVNNKVYVIVSKSCEHPDVPETRHAIRVLEYWSHMVVKTLDGVDKPGMEFVLTYYDEPAVGGMPSGVATWASGRAAPSYLARMRRAAKDYRSWASATPQEAQEMPDFTPFDPELVNEPKEKTITTVQIREQDMESSKQGPEMENGESTRDQSTQTDAVNVTKVENNKESEAAKVKLEESENNENVKESTKTNGRENDSKVDEKGLDETKDAKVGNEVQNKLKDDKKEIKKEQENVSLMEGLTKADSNTGEDTKTLEEDGSKNPEEEENNGGWWRYLYPFYYFA